MTFDTNAIVTKEMVKMEKLKAKMNISYPKVVDAVEEQLPGPLATGLALTDEAGVFVSKLPAEAGAHEAVA